MAILAAKLEEPSVSLPFDIKFRSEFRIIKLLELNVKAVDSMRANFNKQLEGLAKEALKFVSTAAKGEDYVEPEDDTKNIANAENYLPTWDNFVPGG